MEIDGKSDSEDEASFDGDNEDSEESSSSDSSLDDSYESAIHVSVPNKNAEKTDHPYGIRHNSPSRVKWRSGESIYKENNTESEQNSDSESGDKG